MKLSLSIIACAAALLSNAQERIDGTFAFQTDPAKQYSIYIPSGYDASVSNRLMLALHPLNTATWNSISWCDTLVDFAEMNQLLLVAPDGGIDGAIDDPIDTAFTSALLDSMLTWYNIDTGKIYVMGFSWGGKTTYTYGLSHASRFGGFMPIGAAINGVAELSGIIQNSEGKPFFLVHGATDSPNTRFYPLRDALIANDAIENDTLMPGVGHTINFPNRNLILSMAYQWIDSVNCSQATTQVIPPRSSPPLTLFPNPARTEISLVPTLPGDFVVEVLNEHGEVVFRKGNARSLDVSRLASGTYFVHVTTVDGVETGSFIRE